MMKSVLGEAAQVADFTTVRDRLKSSRYEMSFQNGVKFDLNVVTSDSISAATASTTLERATGPRIASVSAAKAPEGVAAC